MEHFQKDLYVMMYDLCYMTKVRTTLMLEETTLEKLRQEGKGNISALANKILKKELFGGAESLFGELKGLVSVEDIEEEEIHEDLYR